MLYKKVMQDLKSRIDSDEFNIGDTLSTEKELIEYYSVSRITIRKAVDELVKLGLVEKRQGAGSSVIGKTMTGSMLNLRSTIEYMTEYGVNLEYQVAEFTLINPDEEVAKALDIAKDDKVYFIRRFKIINSVPAMYEDSYMPVAMFPQMNIMSLQGSKYHYLESELGFEIDGAIQDFEAIMPDKHICEILDVLPKIPILRLLSTGKLKDGRIFEYTKTSFKPNTYSYKHYVKR
ncbi:MAG: GntR family transcriptional regulator [Moritella sp.]|uniref:GntR family transcriptional regulator n=1 Tax=Moritella sp. TaxID=78556 RepID=UPI0029A59F5E|nr:GntR family transcriptional regulator [Moritella sp.]MDX2322403.1 GntR family transcriptional regulator [Moritella sp.]